MYVTLRIDDDTGRLTTTKGEIYDFSYQLTKGFTQEPSETTRVLAALYPIAAGPDVWNWPLDVACSAKDMREVANGHAWDK